MAADPIVYCLEHLTDYTQFERLCHELMALHGYPSIEPLGGCHDKGRDAIHVNRADNAVTIFCYSVRDDWFGKLKQDAKVIHQHKHACDRLTYLSTYNFTSGERDDAMNFIKKTYGWELEPFGLERLRLLLSTKHSSLITNHPQIFHPRFFAKQAEAPEAQLQGDARLQVPGKKRQASKPRLILPTDFSYADSSLADVDFPTVSGDPVSEIIIALRSHVWQTQSPAIEKIFSRLKWPERTADEAFVLGRNIYQCADGNEFRAQDIMNNLRRELAKIPGDWGVHILNGMFYEAYFDCEGKFREGKLKEKYLSKLFELETIGRFADCIKFIRAALEPYRDRLGVLPNTTPESVAVKVKLNLGKDPPVITSIKCRGVEQMIPMDEDAADPAWELSYRPVAVDSFPDRLRKFWNVPEGRMVVSYDTDVLEIPRIRFPKGKSVRLLST